MKLPRRHEYLLGMISDTHGLIRSQALAALAGVELVIHAGDIGSPDVLDALRQVAPVVAVRGNVDSAAWARSLPETEIIEAGSTLLYVLHDISALDLDPVAAGFRAVISGHSHKASINERRGVLYLNPGSAGPRRFHFPVSLGLLRIRDGTLEPQIIKLPV